MKIELIPEAGRFYKVNLHCHTNISDGRHSPEDVKAEYKKRGYAAVCYTDHEVLVGHKDLCDDEFIALHGYEVAVKRELNGHTAFFMPVYHFNLIAKSQDNLVMPRFFLENPSLAGNARNWLDRVQYSDTIETTVYDQAWLSEYIKAVSAAGFLVTYNHPQWSLHGPMDYLQLEGLHAIETINGGCSILHNENTSLHYEQMLRAGKRVVPVGGDDNHRDDDVGLGWTMIKAPCLSYEALMEGYEKGHCYASDGPEIQSLVLEDGKFRIKTSPAVQISLLSEGRYVQRALSYDGDLTEAVLDYKPELFGSYFRFEVRDAKGYHAYSNAYYPKDLG